MEAIDLIHRSVERATVGSPAMRRSPAKGTWGAFKSCDLKAFGNGNVRNKYVKDEDLA